MSLLSTPFPSSSLCFAGVGRWGAVDEAAEGYLQCLWLNVSCEAAVKLPARVVSLQGSRGTTRSISKFIHKVVGRPQICFQVNPHRHLSRAAALCGSWPPPQDRDPTEWQSECLEWKPQSFLTNHGPVIPGLYCIVFAESPLLSPSPVKGEKNM